MSTIQSITLGAQQQIPGISIPVTVTVSGTATAPAYLTAQFRDVIHNTAASVCQQIRNFTQGETVEGITTFTATLEMSESTASQVFGSDFTPEIQVTVFRGAVHSDAKTELYWFSAMQNVTYTTAPAGEKITLYIEADENYINEANLANLTAQVSYSANGAAQATRQLELTAVEGNNHRWTAVLDELVNGVEYELNVGLENDFGTGNSDTSLTEMPSFNPSTVSIDSFDSLDASGGRFVFKCAAFDYSDYTLVNLKVKMTQGNVAEEATIDICGNAPTLNTTSTVEYLKPLVSDITSGSFKVEVFVEGEIAIDASGLQVRTYGGAKASKNYVQDVHMPNPVVTLSEIDWVSGSQTVKAVIDGSFANVTFVFDLSGSVASTTEYDICNTTLKITATKEYSYATINSYDGVRVSVSASRPEVNGGATRSVTEKVEIAHDLMAIKRAPAPEVEIDLLYGNVGGATLTFEDIDISFTSVKGVISLGEDEIVSGIDEDASGAIIELASEMLTPGNRYLVSGYSRLHLPDAGYPFRYTELNEDVHLLSIAESSQYVYSGTPTITLSYRPRDASTNLIDTVRVSGDKSANNVSQIMALVRDVSGHVQQATLTVSELTTDSCGNRLFHAALVDRAGNYTHDFKFEKSLELGEGSVFAFGLLDTPTALDAITTTVENLDDAVTFVAAANAYNTALNEYTVALDLSSNPTKDEAYQGYVTAIANYDISINDLSGAIHAAGLVRDGSNSGSLWFKNQKSDLYNLADARYNVTTNNTAAVALVNITFLTALAGKTAVEEVEFQQTIQEVEIQFWDEEANDISNQIISVPKYPTTGAYYNAESALAHYLELTQTAQADSLVARTAASTVKAAAELAYTNNVASITTKTDLKEAANTNKATAVESRDDRKDQLVNDAAAKKLALLGANGKGTAEGCATRVLKDAHALFDA